MDVRFNMCAMSEGSLPPFKYLDPRRYPARIRDAAERLIGRLRRSERCSERRGERGEDETGGASTYPGQPVDEPAAEKARTERSSSGGAPAASPPVASTTVSQEIGEEAHRRAAKALEDHLRQNATSLDRAVRMRDQAERLDREGTPSDSARNRADRAREELADGIARLRRAMISSGEEESARALDLQAMKIDPPIQPAEIR